MTLNLSHYEKGHSIKKYLAGAKRNHSVEKEDQNRCKNNNRISTLLDDRKRNLQRLLYAVL